MSNLLEMGDASTEAVCRALVDCGADFVCLATTHGEPFYLNPAGRRLIGVEDEAGISTVNLRECYTEESWKELRDVAVPAVNKSGHWEGQSRVRNLKTGELTGVHTIMYRVKVPQPQAERPVCLAIIHRDAVPWNRLREALGEAQARKNSILESSLDPIITINHEGVITEFNRAAEQTFGHSREKVLGTRPSEVLFPPSMSDEQRGRIERYLSAGEGSMLGRRIEATVVRANGESFPAEMAMTISQEQGAPVLTFFVRDISLRKKAEEEQARYAADLERSNRDLEQFAYVASHDLQEPLRKIRTFGDRLELKCQDLLDETGHECIQRMQSAAARMQELIDGLLALSRVTTRSKDFVLVNLGSVAREVVCDLEAQIERVGGRVEVGVLPTIQADPLQMRQLLQNLIANALKFRRAEQTPVVRVEGRFLHSPEQRRPLQSPADEQCRITVEDNGIGFDEQYRERIFGIFQRLHPRDVYEGTGIGLALCRKIVEHHGGKITACGTPGKGAVFEVLLPAAQGGKGKGKTPESLE
jgi:two-component system, LuxR family, sensor kinase FixL